MTYNEIKRRLIKCEKTLALFQKQDLSKSTPDERQQAQSNIISVNEAIQKYRKILSELNESKTYIVTPKSGQTSAVSMSDDEVEALKDAEDVEAIKSVDGDEVKERLNKNSGVEFSVNETKAIAKQVGKAVAKSLKALGDSVTSMKATHIEENSFDIEVIYKNNSDDAFSFHVIDDTLHLADFSFDKELVDVGVKPSGEAIVNVDVLSNELQKHFKSLSEKVNYKGRELSHEETDRLDLIAHKEFGGKDFNKLSDEDKEKVFAKRDKVGVKEDDNEGYTKHKLLAYLGQADDAMIRTHDDKYLIIYNPKNGNDDNAAMWHDDTVFGVDQDGEEHEVRYDQIDALQLEKHDPDQEQKDDEEDHGVGYDDEGRPLGEGEGDDHHYLKVSKRDYKKAQAILDQNIDPTYVKMEVVDNDGAGNVIFYFIFKHEDGFDDMYGDAEADSEFYQEPEEDGGAFVYDAVMDLQSQDIEVVDHSGDMDEATDINDPVLMRMRVAKRRNADLKKVDQMHARDRKDQRINGKKRLLIAKLKDKRAEIEREMENDPEIEPTGGPVADRYGDMLNKIDNAIEKAAGRIKPMDYDTAVGKVNEDEGHLVTFGYDLNRIEDVVKHLQSKYKEGQDFELHIGRGDDLPNAVTLKNPALEKDHDLNDMLNAAQSDQDRYDAYTDYDQRRKEDDDYYEDPDYYKESMKEGTELYDKGGMQIKRFAGRDGLMVQITVGREYIHVTADQFEILAKAMQSVTGDLRDMSTQYPRKKNVDEVRAAKVQKAHSLVVAKMKELAKQYKAGDKSVVPQLKDLTAKKKALEADLDQAVAGTHKGQELTELSGDQREAIMDLQSILDDLSQKGDEAREIVREKFPRMLSKGDAYGAFEFGTSGNRYDTTLESIIEEIEEYYDEEDDAGYSSSEDPDSVVNEFDAASMKAYGDAVKKAYGAKKKKDKDKKPLNEFTDDRFKGSEVIDDANKRGPDMFGKQIFADLLPKGVASENDAIESLKKHDKSGIKARMGRYAPMFVHMQYHELEHEGEKYRMHQKQYYNSNFKDKDPDFNPAVSKITLMKVDENDEGKNLGVILVKTDEYIKDLRNLPGLGKRHMEEATRKDLGMVTSVSKRRAGAELKQKLAGKRSDGMGKYDGNIYGLDNDGKRVELKSLNDLNKFKKFELDADIEEAGPGFMHDCAAHVVHEVYGAGICLDEQHTLVKEGNKHVVTHYDVFFKKGNRLVEDVPAEHLKVITMNEHWHKGYKKKKK